MTVVALIADLVASRTIPERAGFQELLLDLLKGLNARGGDIPSPSTLALGDAFPAPSRCAGTLLRDAILITAAVHPQPVRFSICRGELSTAINRERALGMDGPAFHEARAQMEQLKQSRHTVVAMRTGGDSQDRLINSGLRLLFGTAQSWNGTAWRILDGLLRGVSVQEMEANLPIRRRAIYKIMASRKIRDSVAYLEEVIRAVDGENL